MGPEHSGAEWRAPPVEQRRRVLDQQPRVRRGLRPRAPGPRRTPHGGHGQRCGEKGIRLAQILQAGPCIPVGMQP